MNLETLVLEKAGGEKGLEKECFAMAAGEKGCRLVKDEDLVKRMVERLCLFAGREDLQRMPEGQPFRLRLIKGLLERAGDSDYAFLEQAEEGLLLGILNPLPRTPQSFQRQVKWSLQHDPTMEGALMKENYPSAKEHEQHVRAHLKRRLQRALWLGWTRSSSSESSEGIEP